MLVAASGRSWVATKSRQAARSLSGTKGSQWSGRQFSRTALVSPFNRLWSRRVLSQGAVVLLITDGLERDCDDILAFEMDRLHRSCRRLIWLNPLLRFEGFQAAARCIRTMLPHVYEFRAVHSLEALTGLCEALARPGGAENDPKLWLGAARRAVEPQRGAA